MKTEVLREIPEVLINGLVACEKSVAPSFSELKRLSEIDEVTLSVPVVYDDSGQIVACAACQIETRRHHGLTLKVYGLFGYHLHDYCRIYAQSAQAMTCLKEIALKEAKRNNCDILVWENIPSELVPKGTLIEKVEYKIFEAHKENAGWASLYNRRSVKRFSNKVRRLGEINVKASDGAISQQEIDELAKLHISRWNFAASSSAFASNPKRKDEYLVNIENKHYLTIRIGRELLACHYGMRYGDTLLWHTPLINPKYLEYSPLRLLLAETAKYCERTGLSRLDFGLGDESYKDEYCKVPRHTCSYVLPLTIKGKITQSVGARVGAIAVRLMPKAKEYVRQAKRILTKTPKVSCFASEDAPCISGTHDNLQFDVIETWIDFYEYCSVRGQELHTWQYERFIHDRTTSFIALSDGKEILSFGWASTSSPFYIGENRSSVSLNGRVCLYDFVTPEAHRCKGYYTDLLKHAMRHFGRTLIYARKDNAASVRAILKAGFRRI